MAFIKNKFGISKFAEKIKDAKVESRMGDGVIWAPDVPVKIKYIMQKWNMDTTEQVSIDTGIDPRNMVGVHLRYVDSYLNPSAYNFFPTPSDDGTTVDAWISTITTDGHIVVKRRTGGVFDGGGAEFAEIQLTIWYKEKESYK